MSSEDKIEILKDILKPDIRKLLVYTHFETISDLKQVALEIENLDEEKRFKITKPMITSDKSREEIDLTAEAIESSKKDLVFEYCSKTGQVMLDRFWYSEVLWPMSERRTYHLQGMPKTATVQSHIR